MSPSVLRCPIELFSTFSQYGFDMIYRDVPLGLPASPGSRPSFNRGNSDWDKFYKAIILTTSPISWPAVEQFGDSGLSYSLENSVVVQANLFYRMAIVRKHKSTPHLQKRLHPC
jgi:hypothetical protein